MTFNEDTQKYNGWIYKITNLINQKVYIGQTSRDPQIRWVEHKRNAAKNVPGALYSAIRKYGEKAFTFEIICLYEADNEMELNKILNEKETYYVECFDAMKNGYNMTKGGDNPPERRLYPVDIYKKDGTFIKSYDSYTEAAKELKVEISAISQCVSGVYGSFSGYVARKHGNPFDEFEIDRVFLQPQI